MILFCAVRRLSWKGVFGMNENVLRGFCQCSHLVFAEELLGKPWAWQHPGLEDNESSDACFQCECGEPVNVNGFLSAKQMLIIYNNWTENPEGLAFARKLIPGGDWGLLFIKALQENPFLVAKILRDAEQNEAVDNLKKLPKEYRDEILKENEAKK